MKKLTAWTLASLLTATAAWACPMMDKHGEGEAKAEAPAVV